MTELIIRYAEPSGVMDRTVIPSEVVGELVRCKDCRYSSWNKYSNSLDCYHFAEGDVDDNDFCSRAKMKGGTDD